MAVGADRSKILVHDRSNGVWLWDAAAAGGPQTIAKPDSMSPLMRLLLASPGPIATRLRLRTLGAVVEAGDGHAFAFYARSTGQPDDKNERRPTVFDADGGRTEFSVAGPVLQSPHALALSDNGAVFAMAAQRAGKEPQPSTLAVWQVATHKTLLETSLDSPDRISSIALSPDGRLLAVAIARPTKNASTDAGSDADVEARLRVFELPGGSQLADVRLGAGELTQLRFGKHGAIVAGVLSGNGALLVFDTGFLRRLDDPRQAITEGVRSFTFMPDDSAIALLDRRKGLSVVNITAAGLHERRLAGPDTEMGVLRYTPDGKVLVAGARDGSLVMWDAASSEPVARLRSGHLASVSVIGFDRAGKLMISGDALGQIALWDLAKLAAERSSVEASLCASATQNLGLSAWKTYMKDSPYRRTCAALPPGEGVVEDLLDQAARLADRSQTAGADERLREATRLVAGIQDAKLLDKVCWSGVLLGQGRTVLPTCDTAVGLQPLNGHYLDSRGLAQAQAGNYAKAAADIRAAIADSDFPSEFRSERLEWAARLERGHTPIDAVILRRLRARKD